MAKADSRLARKTRQRRVRKKVRGTSVRPRLSVFRSLNHIYAQVLDDSVSRTLVSMSTLDPEAKQRVEGIRKTKRAEVVGSLLAKKALDKGIRRVVFDRGGYKYHGRVKALAEAARVAGLDF
jgi:large subunit ribosomal protein L18